MARNWQTRDEPEEGRLALWDLVARKFEENGHGNILKIKLNAGEGTGSAQTDKGEEIDFVYRTKGRSTANGDNGPSFRITKVREIN